MKPYFKELFDYNHHYNQKLTEVFNDNSVKTSEKSVKLFNHVLNAHQIWNNRIKARQSPFGVWDIHAVQVLKSIDQTNYEMTMQLLDKFDLNEMIHYSKNNGATFSRSVQDMLFHIINHTTYHRGEIATEFKNHGLDLLVTYYIFFKRT